jgi:hypothetical protein
MPRRQNRGMFLCACELARPFIAAAGKQLPYVVPGTVQIRSARFFGITRPIAGPVVSLCG